MTVRKGKGAFAVSPPEASQASDSRAVRDGPRALVLARAGF